MKGISRPTIERILILAHRLRHGKQVNCPIMAARLGVTPKTIHRDLEFMRDRLRYEIQWHPPRRTYILVTAPHPTL